MEHPRHVGHGGSSGRCRTRAGSARLRLVVGVAAAAALTLGAVGCGDGGSDPGPEASGGDPAASVATNPEDEPDRSGEGSGSRAAGVPEATAGAALVIDSAEARALREADPRTVVIDVRDVEDYIDGHVVGAQNIDVQNDGLWERRTDALDKDRATVVYCGTGELSARAAQKLVDMGFTEVYDLGGMADWTDGDLPVDR